MKIVCASCKKSYDIPDDRLPPDRIVSFPCPSCKSAIHIDTRKSKEPSAVSESMQQPEPEKDWPKGEPFMSRIMSSANRLPTISQVVVKAQQVIADPKAGNEEIAAVIETDQAISAAVLRIANSAYYNQSGKVSSILKASVLLGLKTLGEAVDMAGTSGILSGRLAGYGMEAGELWRHSLAVACGTRILARSRRSQFEGEAFLAGLLHDIGKLVLNHHAEERSASFARFMKESGRPFLVAEKEIFGFDHADMGHEICAKWQFPPSLAAAIRYHHYPGRSMGHDLAYFVNIANKLAILAGYGKGTMGPITEVDAASLRFLDVRQSDLDGVMKEMKEMVEKMAV